MGLTNDYATVYRTIDGVYVTITARCAVALYCY